MKSKKDADLIKESNLTYEDYAAMPDDGNRYELASGTLEVMSPAPSPKKKHRISNYMPRMAETTR